MDPVFVRFHRVHPDEIRDPGWDTGWRDLPFILIERPRGGTWRCLHPGGELRVTDRELLVVPAGCRHRLRRAPGGTMRSDWAYLSWSTPDGVEPALGGEPRRLGLDAATAATACFVPWRDEADALAAQAGGLQVLAALRAAARTPLPPADPLVAAAIEHMRRALERPLDRARLAAAVHLSVGRFHDRFVAVTGEAPMRYLQRLRLQRAQALLQEPDLSLGAIAERCGFASQAYFTRVFARAFGEPPGRYRASGPGS